SSYGDHRALHSFPTRRSSDLLHAPERQTDPSLLDVLLREDAVLPRLLHLGAHVEQRAARHRIALADGPVCEVAEGEGTFGAERRSEEHTSELQSRRDLVCRLL